MLVAFGHQHIHCPMFWAIASIDKPFVCGPAMYLGIAFDAAVCTTTVDSQRFRVDVVVDIAPLAHLPAHRPQRRPPA